MDSPETVTITITPEDIDKGQCHHPLHCAAALALARRFPEASRVFVGHATASVEYENGGVRRYDDYTHSSELMVFVRAFDEGTNPQPGDYALERWRK